MSQIQIDSSKAEGGEVRRGGWEQVSVIRLVFDASDKELTLPDILNNFCV